MKFSEYLQNEEVWDKPNPNKGKSGKMSPAQKAEAKRRAKAAGRPYPNLVDNMAAMKEEALKELSIYTIDGKKKQIKKVPLTTIDGRKIMAYPDSAGNGSNGD